MQPYGKFESAQYEYNDAAANIDNWITKEKISKCIIEDFKFAKSSYETSSLAIIAGQKFNIDFTHSQMNLEIFNKDLNLDIEFPGIIEKLYLFNVADLYVQTSDWKLYYLNIFEYQAPQPQFFKSFFTKNPKEPELICDFARFLTNLDLIHVTKNSIIFKDDSRVLIYSRSHKNFMCINLTEKINSHFYNSKITGFVTDSKISWATHEILDKISEANALKTQTTLSAYSLKEHEQFISSIGDLFFTFNENQLIARSFSDLEMEKKITINLTPLAKPKLYYCQQLLFLKYRDNKEKKLCTVDFLEEKIIYEKKFPLNTDIAVLEDRIVKITKKSAGDIFYYEYTDIFLKTTS